MRITIKKLGSFCCLIFFIILPFQALATLNIVAAENFYGKIAQQLGGEYVTVRSILQNPDQDPHMFSADPSIAKMLANANIVIYNGLGYDDWMAHLLSTKGQENRKILVISDLIGAKVGANPHIWYIPTTMRTYAQVLAQQLIILDPQHADAYRANLQAFMQQQQAFENLVKDLRQKLAGTPVTATEPVFGYMADALGMKILDLDFQLSVMNETPPSPSAVKAIMNNLKNRNVKILFYNQQTTDPATENIKKLASVNQIPTIGVTETQPLDMNYQQWMEMQLMQVTKALNK